MARSVVMDHGADVFMLLPLLLLVLATVTVVRWSRRLRRVCKPVQDETKLTRIRNGENRKTDKQKHVFLFVYKNVTEQ